MIIFCILALIDFGLTYYAIKADLAYELNQLIAWSLEYSLIPSLLIRLAFMATLLIPFHLWARKRQNYRKMVRLALVLESGIILLHLRWIIPLLTY